MHVKDLHVTRYGPMTPFEHDGFAAFTVIHGPNEQGKTLLIDALFKLLFKKELKRTMERHFGNMKRVNEQPEGYVVLRTHADEVKLEKDETLSMYFPVGPDDFRNVFLIRDSDLQIVDERDYYASITERLTGLRSSEIEAVLKIAQGKGRLRSASPDSALANSAGQGKIAETVRAAERVMREIQTLRDALAFERFDELTGELVDARRRRRALAEEREGIRAAEKRRRLEHARTALAELKGLEQDLATMGDLDERTLRRWQRIAIERDHVEKDVASGVESLERLKNDAERATTDAATLRSRSDEAERMYRDTDAALSRRVDEYQRDRAEFRSSETTAGLWQRGSIAASVLLVLALAAYTFAPSIWVGIVAGAALLGAFSSGALLWRHHRKRGELEKRAGALCTDAARWGVKADDVLDLQSALSDLERGARTLRDQERAQSAAAERVTSEARKLEERLAEQRARIGGIDAEVATLKASTRSASHDDYQTAIDRRKSLEASRDAKRELLQGLVPVAAKGAEAIPQWRAAVEGALAATAAPERPDGDPERGARLDRELEELESRERDIAERLSKGGKQIYNAQMKAADLKVLDETPRCRTLHDLDHVAARIAEFCRRIEREQETAQLVISLFLEIDAEERARVGELFGPAAHVSTVFREVTDGRYRSVGYDVEADQVLVEQADGRSIRATALSGGALDQLYLAIRVGIAEKLLPASKGFFIMDDPFIKADGHRLGKLMETLRRLVRGGWQILYFTAKKEVLDALAADIRAGDVRLVELGRDLFSAADWSERPATHSRTT